jgi:hypothetical protein
LTKYSRENPESFFSSLVDMVGRLDVKSLASDEVIFEAFTEAIVLI